MSKEFQSAPQKVAYLAWTKGMIVNKLKNIIVMLLVWAEAAAESWPSSMVLTEHHTQPRRSGSSSAQRPPAVPLCLLSMHARNMQNAHKPPLRSPVYRLLCLDAPPRPAFYSGQKKLCSVTERWQAVASSRSEEYSGYANKQTSEC